MCMCNICNYIYGLFLNTVCIFTLIHAISAIYTYIYRDSFKYVVCLFVCLNMCVSLWSCLWTACISMWILSICMSDLVCMLDHVCMCVSSCLSVCLILPVCMPDPVCVYVWPVCLHVCAYILTAPPPSPTRKALLPSAFISAILRCSTSPREQGNRDTG